MLQLSKVPKEFSREALLHALAQLIACDDQVSKMARKFDETSTNIFVLKAFALVSKAVFRNCLTVMQPKTRTKELPSAHDVTIYIQNEFIRFMDQIKQVIQVSGYLIAQ